MATKHGVSVLKRHKIRFGEEDEDSSPKHGGEKKKQPHEYLSGHTRHQDKKPSLEAQKAFDEMRRARGIQPHFHVSEQ